MKRGIILALAAVFALVSILTASAEIMLSTPKSVYNIGDTLEISATVKATQETSGFLELSLKCGQASKLFYLSPVSLAAGQEEKVSKKLIFSKDFLQGMGGNCYVNAKQGSEAYSSQVFKISDKISMSVSADRASVNPGEKIKIAGSAVKENGQSVDGFAELSVDGTDIKTVSTVSSGNIFFNFSFPDSQKSGSYSVKIYVYEKIGDEVTNFGEQSLNSALKQQPRKMEISIDTQNIIPGTSIKFMPVVYDQAGEEVSGDANLEIIDSSDELYLNMLVPLSQTQELEFPENADYGSWKITAGSLGLEASREFMIEQLEKAKFDIVNDTLEILNVGNVPYKKAVQVSIGSELRVIEMNLDLGESKSFELTGDGVYDVKVSDGIEDGSFSGMSLTGGVTGISEIRSRLNVFNKYPILWLFLILLGGLFAFILSQRVIKKKYYGYEPREENKGFERVTAKKISDIPVTSLRNISEAEYSLVLQGNKEEASVVNLKIKNSLTGNAGQSVEMAISAVNEHKGTLQKNADGYSAIFVPSLTKTFKNDMIAVRVASGIASHLNEHNKKFRDKIEYGIGINSGELATRIHEGKLKFTALGNVINLAKKIADSADKTVLISRETNKKIMNEVKTLKQGEFYSISRIVERESNKDFLNKFMERNKFS